MKTRLLNYFLLITTVAFLAGCDSVAPVQQNTGDDEASFALAGITTKKAKQFNDMFNTKGNGWTGGDGAYSIYLPDGRTLWMFGDSFLDTVYADYSRPSSGLVRNTFVVQNGMSLTTLVTGTIDDPAPFVNTADPDNEWYWPGDGTVVGDTLYVYMMYFIRTGMGGFDFSYQRTDLVTFSLPSITEVNRTTISSGDNTLWGCDVMEDGDYIYVYGAEQVPLTKYMHIARLPADNMRAPMEFWNGSVWTTTKPAANAGRLEKQSGLAVDVSAQFAVFKQGTVYRMLTQEGFLGPTIYSWESTTPKGPWKKRQTAYVTPETGGSLFTYNAWVHPEFVSADGSILMSYSENSSNFFDLFSDARIYRPKFVWVKYL